MMQVHHKRSLLNSYEEVIREYGITAERFYEVGIKLCLFVEPEVAMQDWHQLREQFLSKKKPGMGLRMVMHEPWLRVFYRDLFGLELVKDQSGNQAPNALLCDLLGIKKPANYVCAHVFGGTNNPLLFNALFNICYIPAIYAPLTSDNRHKMTPLHVGFRQRFMARVQELYGEVIDEYDAFLQELRVMELIDSRLSHPEAYPKRFIANMKEQWLPLRKQLLD